MRNALILLTFAATALTGCDQINQKLGLEDPAKKEARQEAEGKAVGSACRHSGRAIEDCYSIYSWLPKSPIYEGWKEMDAYMRENKIGTVEPQLPPPEGPGKKKKKAEATEDSGAKHEEKVAEKSGDGGNSEKSEDKSGMKPGEKSADKPAEKPEEKTPDKPKDKASAKH